jgi:hypothetical protein
MEAKIQEIRFECQKTVEKVIWRVDYQTNWGLFIHLSVFCVIWRSLN